MRGVSRTTGFLVRALTPVWRNAIGGVTFRTDDGRYVKDGPRNAETSMRGEADRLAWAGTFAPLPRVLNVGGDDDDEWLVPAAVPGQGAVAPRWTGDPARVETAVRAVGSGLRALHDALPVASCPFDWGVESRVADAVRRGIRLLDALRRAPQMDRAVVCHGDACCPNTVIDDDGQVTGHVDLGALGIADRWADIAVAASVVRTTARSGTPPERTPRPREKPLRARDTTQCGVSRDESGFSATGAARDGGRPG